MVLDIDRFRPEKGGDPKAVKENQRKRYSDENMVDKIVEADEKWRRGMLPYNENPYIRILGALFNFLCYISSFLTVSYLLCIFVYNYSAFRC